MTFSASRLSLYAAIFLAVLPRPVLGQGVEAVKAAYTKYEYRIAMRDGVKLFTAVYIPKDDSQKYPILLTRTPYSVGPYGVDNYKDNLGPSPLFAKEGYIFAYQDVRGRWMSEGTHVNMRPINPARKTDRDIDESTDAYDTFDWLIKNVPGNNGKAGLWGISYPGFYTAAGMINAHPALKAASPERPSWTGSSGTTSTATGRSGCLTCSTSSAISWPRPYPVRKGPPRFEHGTSDGYDFFLKMGPLSNADRKHFKGDVPFWNEVMDHPDYTDFWKSRNLRPHLKGIKPAVMTVGGWFDAENLFGAMETYRHVEANSPGCTNVLVMGPWYHGGWNASDGRSLGNVQFNAATSEFYRQKIELPFFEFHLKGKGKFDHPEAWVFETGTNVWRRHDTWPPKPAKAKNLYLRKDSRLSWDAPGDETAEEGHDEYVSDPNKPVPFQEKIAIGMSADYMTGDQRFASRRPDVLTYQGPVLEEDLTVAGPIEVELHVSTTGTDSDWIVKVIDVYPDDYPDSKPDPKTGGASVPMGGYQQLVRGDVMRGRYRNSYEKPEAFEPGTPARVRFRLQDVYHAFRSGHRVMIQVQSSWFPLADRNPQTFVDIYKAKESDFRKATQRVYRTKKMASRVTVMVRP